MPLYHKFQNHNWNNNFYTEDSILKCRDYEPEVMIIGTFNPGDPWHDNQADFFYGRGMYMWPILANLFIHGHNHIASRRVNHLNPTLDEIFQICRRAKLSFADVIRGTDHDAIPHPAGGVVVDGYHWDTNGDDHLDHLGEDTLEVNVPAICRYLTETPSIKHVYFTYKTRPWLVQLRNQIINAFPNRNMCSIFTPTGSGFGRNLPGFPTKLLSLAHCWVWNNHVPPHAVPINRDDYGHLDHEWLTRHGVNVNIF